MAFYPISKASIPPIHSLDGVLESVLALFGRLASCRGNNPHRLLKVEGHSDEVKLQFRFGPPQVSGPLESVSSFKGAERLFHDISQEA